MGIMTASKFKDVLAKGAGKTRKAYMYLLAAESITSEPIESFSNEYMEWGTITEPQARAMYELESGNTIEQVAFIKPSEESSVGCSPDGLVGEKGMIEIKCPKTTTQIETFLKGDMPTGHKAQVQGQMWVSEREWCDFVSFDPRIAGEASYFCTRIHRDPDYIDELNKACATFSEELTEMIKILRGNNG